MTLRVLVRLAPVALLGSIGAYANHAHAFCRATTVEGTQDSCKVCETSGYPLAWDEPDITYTFSGRDFPDFTDEQLRGIFSTAVDAWQSVSCDQELVEIDVRAASGSTELGPRDPQIEPKVNVIGYLTAEEWAAEEYDVHAFAQTGVRYFKTSGVIAGADIWFNGGMGTFGVCPSGGCEDPSTIDLPNVVTHELGHFYGLAHSAVDGATMGCDARPSDTDKRSLARDDRQGMCAIYPPGRAFQGPYVAGTWTSAPKSESSCSVRAPGAASSQGRLGALGLSLLALACVQRRRGRRGS